MVVFTVNEACYLKTCEVVYTVNKVALGNIILQLPVIHENLQLPVSLWKLIATCYHRNKLGRCGEYNHTQEHGG